MPQFHVIAGPNGAGKSTYTSVWRPAFPVFDPDQIASLLPPSPGSRILQAGRQLHQYIRSAIDDRRSFAVETTLSGRNTLRLMRECRAVGYAVYLHFIYVDGLKLSRARVAQRVNLGGHGVPESDQARRYGRSLNNLKTAVKIANVALLHDNSSVKGHNLVAMYDSGARVYSAFEAPWLP